MTDCILLVLISDFGMDMHEEKREARLQLATPLAFLTLSLEK